jgi:cytosine/adenosine deaminase-related metal-dependent hydrolase
LIVRNAVLFTANAERPIVDAGAIAVHQGEFVAIDADNVVMAQFSSGHVVDAQGAVVHPGYIDPHIHITQYTARTILPLMQSSKVTMGHWKECLLPEDELASAALASMDLLRCGYTGFVDPGTAFEPQSVATAAERAGIRGWVTDPYVADRADYLARRIPSFFSPGSLKHWPRCLEEAIGRIGKQLYRNQDANGLVRGYVGIYGEGTDSVELHQAALSIARENDVQFHKHLGYSPALYEDLEREEGRSPVHLLKARALLEGRVTLIHMNRLSDPDTTDVADAGARLVWCPYGQLAMLGSDNGARGRMASAHRMGVSVGIASDIARGFNFDDLGKLALASASASGDPVKGAEIFSMRTLGSAAAIGARDKLGSLEVGKRADFVVRRPECTEEFGFDRYLEFAVIAGKDTVDQVFVDGKQVLDNGRLLNVDETAVIHAARTSARSIAGRIGLR